jgi:hypothetical protein
MSAGFQGVLTARFAQTILESVPVLSFTSGQSTRFQTIDFKLSIKLTNKQESIRETEWFTGVILKAYQDMTPFGVTAVIIGSDFTLSMKSNNRTQHWPGTFDAIVSSIAASHGLIADVDPADETLEQQPVGYWQYGETDWRFVHRLMQKQISALTRRGDYEMWVSRGNILHVRPPGLVGPGKKLWGTGDLGRGLKAMKFWQRKKALQLAGGFAVQGIGYDTLLKIPLVTVKNFPNFPEKTAHAPMLTPPLLSEIPARTFRSTSETLPELVNDSTAVLGEKFRRMYMADLSIFPDFSLQYGVGDVITLALDQPAGKVDKVFSGNYLLEQRMIRLVKSDMTMKLRCSRVGEPVGEQPLVGQSMDQPAPELAAGRVRQAQTLAAESASAATGLLL